MQTLVKLIATATSGLVSFTTNVIRPVKVTCEFTPVQKGTGDPSPDNIRPISGWTGLDIEHTGKNLFNRNATPFQEGKYVAVNETTVGGSLRFVKHANYSVYEIQVVAGQTYTFGPIKANDPAYAVTDSNGIVLLKASNQGGQFGVKHTVQMPSESAYLYLSVGINGTYKCDDILQVEIGTSTTSSYESYQGETIPITITDPTTGGPMTVYGGTVTLNEDGSADLVVDKAAADLSTLTWSQFTKTRYVTEDLATTLPAAPDHNTKIGCISEKYTEYTQNRLYGGSSDPATIGMSVSNMRQLCIRTAQSYSVWGDTPSGKFVYPLMNPVTYHFDNIAQLNSFLGTNNIWHDMNGDITVEYWNKQ